MKTNEYKNFERVVNQIMKVTHDEIKAKLEAEKKDKAERKRKKVKRPD